MRGLTLHPLGHPMGLATLLELLASFLQYTTSVVDYFARVLQLWCACPVYQLQCKLGLLPFCGSWGQLQCTGWHQVALPVRQLSSADHFEIAWLQQLIGLQLMQLR